MTRETSPSVAQGTASDGARGSRPDRGAASETARGSRPNDGLVYVSGAFRTAADASVSVFDHGLLYGDGIFEGIRAYNGRVFRLERHIER